MRIALFGGSFNPPHVSHQLVCAWVLATARPERLLMVPTFKHPFDKQLAPYDDRVAMCERAVEIFNGRIEVSRIEERLGGESYTLRTVKALLDESPGARVAIVIGADLVAERERWHGWPELSTLAEFIVVGRGPNELIPPLSSTEIRATLARGERVDGLVDKVVQDYIFERGLYK